MAKYKVALGQFESIPLKLEKNYEKAVQMIQDAGKQGVDIMCFPEMFLSGYFLEPLLDPDNSAEDVCCYDKIKELAKLAAKENMALILPGVKKEGFNFKNVAYVFSKEGVLCGTYAKQHLFRDEKKAFQPGESAKIFQCDNLKFGISICYDTNFPEPCRILALQGAKVIFVPGAWCAQDGQKWDLLLRTRALENQVFVVGVNAYAKDQPLELYGHSKVVSPWGDVLKETQNKGDDLIIFTIDDQEVDRARKDIFYLEDMKFSGYSF